MVGGKQKRAMGANALLAQSTINKITGSELDTKNTISQMKSTFCWMDLTALGIIGPNLFQKEKSMGKNSHKSFNDLDWECVQWSYHYTFPSFNWKATSLSTSPSIYACNFQLRIAELCQNLSCIPLVSYFTFF